MDPKQQIKIALAQAGITQAELARRLDIAPQTLSRTLGLELVNTRSNWPEILEALNLEVVLQPKNQR